MVGREGIEPPTIRLKDGPGPIGGNRRQQRTKELPAWTTEDPAKEEPHDYATEDR